MLARTHGLIAFASLAGVAWYTDTPEVASATLIICLIFNTIGALLPDIDQASNRLWDLVPGGEMIGKALGVFMKHRGISHSLLGIFLADKFVFWLINNLFNQSFLDTNLVYWSLMIGYISHIAADALTEEGVPLLYPLKISFGMPPVRSWRIKTGGWFENIVVVPVAILVALYFISQYWRK